MAAFDFIEGWYNPHRRHSALGYQSPSAFERESREFGGSVPGPRSLVSEEAHRTGLSSQSVHGKRSDSETARMLHSE